MKVATALLRSGKVYTQSYAQTTAGVWIAWGPIFVSPLSAVEETAANIRASLDRSIRGVPHPNQDEWKEVQRPMLEAIGLKSWTNLAKGAKSVGIESDHAMITLTPSRDYAKQGGEELPDRAIKVPLSGENLGAIIIEAFNRSS